MSFFHRATYKGPNAGDDLDMEEAGKYRNIVNWNLDFLLAAQWQDSTQSTSTRGVNVCDINFVSLSGSDASNSQRVFTELAGLKGTSKCTHQVQV